MALLASPPDMSPGSREHLVGTRVTVLGRMPLAGKLLELGGERLLRMNAHPHAERAARTSSRAIEDPRDPDVIRVKDATPDRECFAAGRGPRRILIGVEAPVPFLKDQRKVRDHLSASGLFGPPPRSPPSVERRQPGRATLLFALLQAAKSMQDLTSAICRSAARELTEVAFVHDSREDRSSFGS